MTISKLSGGRDSVAMTLRYLELNGSDSIDYIIFCDTLYEFPQMYDYIAEVRKYLKKRHKKDLTILKPKDDTFYKWAFELPLGGEKRAGQFRGIPRCNGMDYCTRELKIYPTDRFLESVMGAKPNKFRHKILIGYTFNEVENGRNTSSKYGVCIYPLHEWGWNESEVTAYLNDLGLGNPLYKHFQRTGCFLCPKQSIKSFRAIWKHYPREWGIMKEWEAKAAALDCVGKTFASGHRSILDLEKRFEKEAAQGCLFSDDEMELNEVCFLCK